MTTTIDARRETVALIGSDTVALRTCFERLSTTAACGSNPNFLVPSSVAPVPIGAPFQFWGSIELILSYADPMSVEIFIVL